MKNMKKVVLALCATVGLGGCGDLTVPDLNNPSVESFEQTPSRTAVLDASTGLLIGHRGGTATQNGYVSLMGVLGRESYVLDSADPRYIGEMLQGPGLNAGSPAFGGNFWNGPYINIRNANTLLNALDKVTGVSEAEKEAIRGYAKTIQALDFLVIINTRDENGAAIDVNRALDGALAPIVGKPEVMAHIARLLDEAKAHLEAGGDNFPFQLSSGFVEFDATATKKPPMTVKTFIKVNRAVKARVDVYRKDYSQALIDLGESFIDTTRSLDRGVYHVYSTGSGDVKNELNDPNIFANKALVEDAEKQAGSDTVLDERVIRKLKTTTKKGDLPGSKKEFNLIFAQYDTEAQNAPLAIIRNEELILLRAEAHMGLGRPQDALNDLNVIRTTAGKLAKLPEALEGKLFEDELLKQRRYSLMFEGGHRWIDMRRFGRLAELRREDPSDQEFTVHASFPIPKSELDGRQ
ncbi:RagB/SusD family nutrient uptake outer membrane protein [Archangium sp.]|uniref:RagB/SusD family nutrient uptake outer membrane protein n=1 Tax=Archangium sp. TaxID=1872627 RepID=UPI002ED78707